MGLVKGAWLNVPTWFLLNNGMERTWKENNIRCSMGICLEELRKTTKDSDLPAFGRRCGCVIHWIWCTIANHRAGTFGSPFSVAWPSDHYKTILYVATRHRVTKCEFSYPGNWITIERIANFTEEISIAYLVLVHRLFARILTLLKPSQRHKRVKWLWREGREWERVAERERERCEVKGSYCC